MIRRRIRWVLPALALVAALRADAPDAPAAKLQELQRQRTERTRQVAPAEYARVDADLAAQAAAYLDAEPAGTVDPSRARASLMTMAGRHAAARDLLTRRLQGSLDPAERFATELDLMLAAVKLNDGETVYRVLERMTIPPASAATLGSYFGGTFHHYVFNARGAESCLQLVAKIEPALPADPGEAEEARKTHGWARRQLAATKALYLAELGRRDEAVAVLDHALATLSEDVYRKNDLRGDRQRYRLLDRPAPAIAVDRTHGDFPGLEAYRGRVLLLEFTAHWCHACHAAIPALCRLQADLAPKGLAIVSLTTYYGFFGADRARTKDMPRDEEYARMPAMLAKQGVTWPMVYTDRATMDAYGVNGIPQLMLIDKQGRIRMIDRGFSEAKAARWRAQLEALLAE